MTTTQIIARLGWSARKLAIVLSLSLVGGVMALTGNSWLAGIGVGLMLIAAAILYQMTLPKPPTGVLRVRR